MYQQKDNARSMGSKRMVELVHVKRSEKKGVESKFTDKPCDQI